MKNYSSIIWWWSDPDSYWLDRVVEYIKPSFPDNDETALIILHCEDVNDFKKSIPLPNYFFNLYLVLNSFQEERIMFLSGKDVLSSVELYLGRQKKKKIILEESSSEEVSDKEITEFYNRYIESFEETKEELEDESIKAFKKFLKLNNCIDIYVLLDFFLKYEKDDIVEHLHGNSYLILGIPSSPILKKFFRILSKEKICSISIETPLDISLHGSPKSQISEKIKVSHVYVELKDVTLNLKQSLKIGSATEEYVTEVFLSFLSLLINSKNELALSKALISPVINLSHEAFTALKHLAVEKEMVMCQVAISYVTRLRLGGKGYAPPSDCPMLRHLKGLELFVDTLNQMQTIIEEESSPRSAIKKLINVLKKKLLKCSSEKLKGSSVEAVSEHLQSVNEVISEILKSRVSSNGVQICQETLDILYHFVNFVNCNFFIFDGDSILHNKHAKRTPLNLPQIVGYFRSPDEESTCDTKLSLNEDSCQSRNSVVQNATFPSYFHHSESSEVSVSCINSSTPSKLTFKDCVKDIDKSKNNPSASENSEVSVPTKKNRKRSILSEITNDNVCGKTTNFDAPDENDVKKVNKTSTTNCVKENDVGSNRKKPPKKEPRRLAKKFKQIQGQGKITSFFR